MEEVVTLENMGVVRSDRLKNLDDGTLFYLPDRCFRENVQVDDNGKFFTYGADLVNSFLEPGYFISAGRHEVTGGNSGRRMRHIHCIVGAEDGSVHWIWGMVKVDVLGINQE